MSSTGSITASHLAADSSALTVQIQEATGKLARLRAESNHAQKPANHRIIRTGSRHHQRDLPTTTPSPNYLTTHPAIEKTHEPAPGTRYEIEESIISRRYIAKPPARSVESTTAHVPAISVEPNPAPEGRIDDLARLKGSNQPDASDNSGIAKRANSLRTPEENEIIPSPAQRDREPISVQSESFLESRFKNAYENASESALPEDHLKIVL